MSLFYFPTRGKMALENSSLVAGQVDKLYTHYIVLDYLTRTILHPRYQLCFRAVVDYGIK